MTAALLALASAGAFALATVLGHRAASTTAGAAPEPGRALPLQVIGRLLRHPGFLAGQLAGAVGFGLHAAALATGLVVVVQPLLCTGMVMALALGAVVDRRHPDRPLPHRRQWLAALLVVVGLGLFLTTAAPAAGAGSTRGWALPLSVTGFGGLAATVAAGVHRERVPRPPLVLGAVAGTAFGLSGVLLKVVTALPVRSWPTAWPLYALVGTGLLGTVFAQWSYRAGPLVQSQPAQTALEPVIALGLAGPVFAERLASDPGAHTGQLAGLVLMVLGVLEVARHAAGHLPAAAGQARPPHRAAAPPTRPLAPARRPGQAGGMVTDLRLRTAPTADLSPVELDELRALLDAAFAGRFSDDDWSHALGGVHVLATVDGALVGHGSVVVRQLVAGDLPLRTGYVEAVATAARWRGQRIGSAVMAEVERLVTEDFELGALSSSRQAVGLYTARGWQRWTGPVAAQTPEGVVASPGEAVFALPTPRTPGRLDTGCRLVCDWRPGDLW